MLVNTALAKSIKKVWTIQSGYHHIYSFIQMSTYVSVWKFLRQPPGPPKYDTRTIFEYFLLTNIFATSVNVSLF